MLLRSAFASIFLISSLVSPAAAQQWRPVSGSKQANISGMAVIQREKKVTTLLVVHDNKKPGQMRATVMSIAGSDVPLYTPLKWLGSDLPVDLEAVTPVPARPGQFIALGSAGRAYHLKLDIKAASIEVIKAFDLPTIPKDADFEGFDLQLVNGSLIAVWGERGAGPKAATIFWSKIDLENYKFAEVGLIAFRVPYPILDVRHVSDIKVDTSGAVFVSSASDPGDDGPFASALYLAGSLRTDSSSRITFSQPAALTPLYRFDYHKIEAFDLVPGPDGGLIFGTDNEKLGSSIFLTF